MQLYDTGLPRSEWADRVLRLFRLRFHPEVIDGVLVQIAGELDTHQVLREQLDALRRTAHAVDREAAQFVAQWDGRSEWGDVRPLHRLVHELLSAAPLVVRAVNEWFAAPERLKP